MSTSQIYLVDSDVFITAKNLYYAFDICPGFWSSIIENHKRKCVFSVSRVKNELLAGRKTEDLYQWVSETLPASFFLDVDDADITNQYGEIMLWAQRNQQFADFAKAKFAQGADGWLVAYARCHNAMVVTNEQSAPDSKREIKLPDVCKQFGVQTQDLYTMLRTLNVRFQLQES
jgi:hypothetical protein